MRKPLTLATAAVTLAAAAAVAAPGARADDCGQRVVAGPGTSCAFALNVRAAFINHGTGQVTAYSPTTGQSYTMTCVQLRQVVRCTGGDGAEVDIY
jgi:hypothetical protein